MVLQLLVNHQLTVYKIVWRRQKRYWRLKIIFSERIAGVLLPQNLYSKEERGVISPSFLPAAETLVRLLSDLDLCPLKLWDTDSHPEMSEGRRLDALRQAGRRRGVENSLDSQNLP